MRQRLPEAEWGIRGPSSRYGSFVKKLLVVTVLCSLVLAGADGEASAGSPANGSLTIVRVTHLNNLPWDVRSKVLSVAAGGSRLRRLYTGENGAYVWPGSWSPDGSVLTFSTQKAHLNACAVKTLDPNTDTVDTILSEDLHMCFGRPAWSPDGTRLLVLNNEGLITVAPDGSDPTPVPIPTWGSIGGGYDWSPDGTKIVYAQETMSGVSRMVVMDADGTDPVRITRCRRRVCRGGLGDTSPRWSPDGSTIAFVRAHNLYLVAPDGSDLRRLTGCSETLRSVRCRFDDPIWSPDGTLLAFTHQGAVWTMDPDGTHRQRIVAAGFVAAWRPQAS